jgi:hypothetical protein
MEVPVMAAIGRLTAASFAALLDMDTRSRSISRR